MPARKSSSGPKVSIGMIGAFLDSVGPVVVQGDDLPGPARRVEHGDADAPARNQALHVPDRGLRDLMRRARAEDVEVDVVQDLQAAVVLAQRAIGADRDASRRAGSRSDR